MSQGEFVVIVDQKKMDVDEVQRSVEEVVGQLREPKSRLGKEASKRGIKIDYSDFPTFDVKKGKANVAFGGLELLIAIMGSAAAKRVGEDLWVHVILPYLRGTYGDLKDVPKDDGKKDGK